MGSTVDCYITSPKSQNDPGDNGKSLLPGVAAVTPGYLY